MKGEQSFFEHYEFEKKFCWDFFSFFWIFLKEKKGGFECKFVKISNESGKIWNFCEWNKAHFLHGYILFDLRNFVKNLHLMEWIFFFFRNSQQTDLCDFVVFRKLNQKICWFWLNLSLKNRKKMQKKNFLKFVLKSPSRFFSPLENCSGIVSFL